MKKIYYLKTCDTCKKILKTLNLKTTELQEIKSQDITIQQLEEMRSLTDSYDSLLNKRSQLYKSRGLKGTHLSENDIKKLLLEHYTFLKRPVAIVNKKIFIGNNKNNIDALKEALK